MGENAILRLFQLIAAWMGLQVPPVKLRLTSQMSCALKAVDATHESSMRFSGPRGSLFNFFVEIIRENSVEL